MAFFNFSKLPILPTDVSSPVPTSSVPVHYPPAISLLEKLPVELLVLVLSHVDSHSVRSVYKAYPSLCNTAVVVCGESESTPKFFTDLPGVDRLSWKHSRISSFHIRLYDVDDSFPLHELLLDISGRSRSSVSIVNISGDVNAMGRSDMQKVLRNCDCSTRSKLSFQAAVDKSISLSHSPSRSALYQLLMFPFTWCSDQRVSLPTEMVNENFLRGLRMDRLEILDIQFYEHNDIPTITNLDLPRLQIFCVKFYQKMPLIRGCKIGYKRANVSTRTTVEIANSEGYDVHSEAVPRSETHFNEYKNMDLAFTANFSHFSFIGVHPFFIFEKCHLSQAQSLFWYDTVDVYCAGHYTPEMTTSQEKCNGETWQRLECLHTLTYCTSFRGGHLPPLGLPALVKLQVYTNKANLDLKTVLSSSAKGSNGEQIYSNLEHLDIRCDLPLDRVGSQDHPVIRRDDALAFLNSKALKYLSISGCYFGDNNANIMRPHGSQVPELPYQGTGTSTPERVEVHFELVRNMEHNEDDLNGSLYFRVLGSYAGYFTHIDISLVQGGENYTPWDSIGLVLYDHSLVQGTQIKFPLTINDYALVLKSAWNDFQIINFNNIPEAADIDIAGDIHEINGDAIDDAIGDADDIRHLGNDIGDGINDRAERWEWRWAIGWGYPNVRNLVPGGLWPVSLD